MTDIHTRLEDVFRDVFGDDAIVLTTTTTADDIPDWDSVMHINLMFAIEQAFGLEFSDSELGGFANVGELEQFLAERTRV